LKKCGLLLRKIFLFIYEVITWGKRKKSPANHCWAGIIHFKNIEGNPKRKPCLRFVAVSLTPGALTTQGAPSG
jgi:hypothetical protein